MSDLQSCLYFLQRLIQTPSLPGEEGDLARLVVKEMERLDFDEVRIDEAGNVIGKINGQGLAPAVMFNTHLDHVDVGEHSAWPYPPFGGEIHDQKVWGRGAVDIKGPLAAQVHGIASLKQDGKRPPGDVYVTGVVFEEIGGVGAKHLSKNIDTPYVVIGEPSSNELRRGHRGRVEMVLHVKGKSVHASVPHKGVNPLDVISKFILALPTIEMGYDRDLGPSSVAPTLLKTDQISANVIPGEAWLTLDWRTVPGESDDHVLNVLRPLVQRSVIQGSSAAVSIPSREWLCYTGMKDEMPSNNIPFIIREDDPVLQHAFTILNKTLERTLPIDVWRFATDGGHFVRADMKCIGFGPGDETLAHTVQEHVPISQLDDAIRGNAALAMEWASSIIA